MEYSDWLLPATVAIVAVLLVLNEIVYKRRKPANRNAS
jgi:hypothetical protein